MFVPAGGMPLPQGVASPNIPETILVNGQPIDYAAKDLLPGHMRDGMRLYIENRIPPGSFLMAVLSNDLMDACCRADDINRHRLFDFCMWLYNHAPPACFGSRENVAAWLRPDAVKAEGQAA
ncbi:hypothetical protein LCGC14_1760650 [marine sediment metagenome]|uniref:Uncharacterized protein n=1 Tax=marine sediment metagenome TaxID=412755 RepID=A0A0F9HNJ6_9ZZZZ